MASSSPTESADRALDLLLKHELTKQANVHVVSVSANSHLSYNSPFKDATDYLADVPACLAIAVVAELGRLVTGPEFELGSPLMGLILNGYPRMKRQFSNSILKTLAQADACMRDIFLETSVILDLMRIFEQQRANVPMALEFVLPFDLRKMGEIATSCAAKADLVVKEISEVRDAFFDLQMCAITRVTEEGGMRRTCEKRLEDIERDEEEFIAKMARINNDVLEKTWKWVAEEDQVLEALEKSGYASEIARQTLRGLCDSGSAAKEILDLSKKKSLVSEAFIEKKHNELGQIMENLRISQVDAETSKEHLFESTKELVKNLSELNSLIWPMSLKMFNDGLAALSAWKKRWVQLLHLFRMLAGKVNISLDGDLRTFAPAYQAANVGIFLNALAQYYCQVSQRHFMPLAVKLGSLVVLNPEEDADQMEEEMKELKEEAEVMQKRVEKLVIKLKEKNDVRMQRHKAEIERIFGEHVPNVSKE